MKSPLNKGDVLIAMYSRKFPDFVTEGREYKVTAIWGDSFRIVNDQGFDIMPIEAIFRRKEALT